MFNPLEKDLYGRYPQLRELRPSCDNADKVLKYILMMYDPHSPLVKDIRDLEMRKQTAAQLVGFDIMLDDEFLDELFNYKNAEIVNKIDAFLKEYIEVRLWSMIVSNEETFYEYAGRMRQPIKIGLKGDKDELGAVAIKSKLSADMDEINDRLDKYYDKLYADPELKEVKMKPKITPESMGAGV